MKKESNNDNKLSSHTGQVDHVSPHESGDVIIKNQDGGSAGLHTAESEQQTQQ